MVKRERKGRKIVKIKELPAKVKIIRQLTGQEHEASSRLSGLEQREEAAEQEFTSAAAQASASSGNFLIRANASPQQQAAAGNTAVQQRPQAESQEVRRWYAQSARLGAAGQGEKRYDVPAARVIAQNTDPLLANRSAIGRNQELQNLQGNSQNPEENYDLTKPEKKDARRRYPWEA